MNDITDEITRRHQLRLSHFPFAEEHQVIPLSPSKSGLWGASGFNGAAPARARNSDGGVKVVQFKPASTGPRPRGRGIRLGAARGHSGAHASTGPRPRGRGIPIPLTVSRTCKALQRGRARAGAEFRLRTAGDEFRVLASTGPRPRGRGINQ